MFHRHRSLSRHEIRRPNPSSLEFPNCQSSINRLQSVRSYQYAGCPRCTQALSAWCQMPHRSAYARLNCQSFGEVAHPQGHACHGDRTVPKRQDVQLYCRARPREDRVLMEQQTRRIPLNMTGAISSSHLAPFEAPSETRKTRSHVLDSGRTTTSYCQPSNHVEEGTVL